MMRGVAEPTEAEALAKRLLRPEGVMVIATGSSVTRPEGAVERAAKDLIPGARGRLMLFRRDD